MTFEESAVKVLFELKVLISAMGALAFAPTAFLTGR